MSLGHVALVAARRRAGAVVLAVATVAALAGCGGEDLRADAIDEFVRQGTPQSVAECIVDALDEKIGLERLQQVSVAQRRLLERDAAEPIRECLLAAAAPEADAGGG